LVRDEAALMSQEFSFKLAFDDFDLGLLPPPVPTRGSDEFKAKVTQFFAGQFAGFGGRARVIIDDAQQQIEVLWTKDSQWQDPKQKALELIEQGRSREALPILSTLHLNEPTDSGVLFRLGRCYSEIDDFDQAVVIFEKLIDAEPSNVPGLVALGGAEIARGNSLIGEQWLLKALDLQPRNHQALKHLADSLMRQRRFDDALKVIQRSLLVDPKDVAMMIQYGDCLEELGRGSESEMHYRLAIKIGGPEQLIDIAKAKLTKKSDENLRMDGQIRTDIVRCMQDTLRRFKEMQPPQVQAIAFEVAMLGTKGFDMKDEETKYRLENLAGDFTGLELVSIMYAAFEQFAPGTDLGVDFSREYRAALQGYRSN
jgi:tetratricopeptide (TPR) repeat protein